MERGEEQKKEGEEERGEEEKEEEEEGEEGSCCLNSRSSINILESWCPYQSVLIIMLKNY